MKSPTFTGADVTVVIPAYRADETIARALRSVAGQVVAPARVIVVMDGYDDGTAARIEECRPAFEGIELTVLCQDRSGAGAARNRAIAEVDTDLVAFLDADDEWMPEKLARTLPLFDGSGAVVACHDMTVVDRNLEYRTDGVRHLRGVGDAYVALYKRGLIATSTAVASTAAIRECGGFDTTLPAGQDYELWLKVARRYGDRTAVLPEPFTRYHIQPGSITSNVWRRRHCALRIAARHGPSLSGRDCNRLGVIAMRAAVISFEAAVGHRRHRRWLAAVAALALFPVALVDVLRGEDRLNKPRDATGFHGNRSSGGMSGALQRARGVADAMADRAQDKNRLWWEELPMTYAEWSDSERIPRTRADFEAIRGALFGNSPFLRECFSFSARAGKEVLDLGCGSGVTACAFAEIGASVVAADLTQNAIDIARDAAKAWDVKLRLARVDAESMGFADDTFDCVFSWGVLHHSRDTEKAFSEVARVLKPGGNGLIMVYHKTSIVYYLKGFHYLLLKGKIFRGHSLKSVQQFFTDGYYHRHFTGKDLRRALEDAGVQVDRILITQMQKKILPAIPLWLDRYLKARFGWLVVAEFKSPAAQSVPPSIST